MWPVLGRLALLHLVLVVGDADEAGGGDKILAVGIDVLEWGQELGGIGRGVFEEHAHRLQPDVMAEIGRAEHVAFGNTGLQILAEALEGDLRRGAHDIRADARIFRGEGIADAFGGLRVEMGGVPGHLTLALGGGIELRLFGGARAARPGRQHRGGRRGRGGLEEAPALHRCLAPDAFSPAPGPGLAITISLRSGRGKRFNPPPLPAPAGYGCGFLGGRLLPTATSSAFCFPKAAAQALLSPSATSASGCSAGGGGTMPGSVVAPMRSTILAAPGRMVMPA